MTRGTTGNKRGLWVKILEAVQAVPGASARNDPGRRDPKRMILSKLAKALSG